MKYLQQSQNVRGILVCIQQTHHMQLCVFLSVQPTVKKNQRAENGGIGLVSH